MTVVTIEESLPNKLGKYPDFIQRTVPRRGKIGQAYRAVRFGYKVTRRWLSTPQGRRSIMYYARRSKYTRYGTAGVGGGVIIGAIQQSNNPTGQTRNYMEQFGSRRKYNRQYKLGCKCPTKRKKSGYRSRSW